MGTLVFSGEGGSSAQSTLDGTAAGDIWDNGLGISSPSASEAGNNSMMYTLPSLMDDLTVQASYSPGGAGGPSASAIGFTYAGVEGLSVSYGAGQTETIGSEADATTIKGSYAYGSFTFGLSQTDYDLDSGNDDEQCRSVLDQRGLGPHTGRRKNLECPAHGLSVDRYGGVCAHLHVGRWAD